MKKLTLVLLPALVLLVFAGTAFAEEVTREVQADLQAVEAIAVEPAEQVDTAALEFPLTPDFAVTEGGTCTPCTSHSQCNVACGGFGACLRDLGGECGGSPQEKFCFC